MIQSEVAITSLLHESQNAKVHECVINTTQQIAAVKTQAAEFPAVKQLNKFCKEYETGKQFNHPNILKYYSLLNLGCKNAIIMEKHGQNLTSFMKKRGKLSLEQTIDIAVQIIDALSALHAKDIIHGSICPSHILIKQEWSLSSSSSSTSSTLPSSSTTTTTTSSLSSSSSSSASTSTSSTFSKLHVKLCDLGYSTDLRKDHAKPITSSKYDLNLLYLSPEQTGRMNREIDYRTDFYSLGVVLYEMLSNAPPFKSNDTLELLYCHLAKTPKSLLELRPDIPPSIAQIVEVLMSKSADDRYQSASGIKKDLLLCKRYFTESIVAEFIPKQFDTCSIFHLHQKLYGREQELSILLDSFEKVHSEQIPRMMLLVSGYSGIGKSLLIHEVYKPLTRAKGYFISGKFDQLQKNIPYSSIIQAFRQLIDMLLTEGEEKLAEWRRKILEAVGQQAQVLIDVIPEITLLIGKQPPVPTLSAIESESRFKTIFQKFIAVFAQKEHSLILFQDDIQWADLGTLKLIEELMTHSSMKHLLFIGAYRSNEVGPLHPFVNTMAAVKRAGLAAVREILLEPLKSVYICQMVMDSFKTSRSKAMQLAEVIFAKTEGNPFFVIQLLHFLVAEKSIKFNFSTAEWEFDMDRIATKGVTDNVIDMLIQKMQRMSTTSQTIISLAASIGNKIDLGLLSLAYGKNKRETYDQLYTCIKDGLIIQSGEVYRWYLGNSATTSAAADGGGGSSSSSTSTAGNNGVAVSEGAGASEDMMLQFAHDKIQQAAYELMSVEDRRRVHLQIGRLMLSSSAAKTAESMFSILSHYQISKDLIVDMEERMSVAEFSYLTCIKAKECSAFGSALQYISFGIQMLPADCWDSMYELTYKMYKQLCECHYIVGNFEEAEQLYPVVRDKAKSLLEKIEILYIQANQYESQQRFHDSLNTTFTALQALGIDVPWRDRKRLRQMVQEELSKMKQLLSKHKIPDLVNNFEMKNPIHMTAVRLMVSCWGVIYCYVDKDLFDLVFIMMANYTILNGNSEYAGLAYIGYAYVSPSHTNNYDEAYEMSKVGLQLLERYPNPSLKVRAHVINYMGVYIYNRPMAETIPIYEKNYQMALQYGERAYACYCAYHILTMKFYSGSEELQQLYHNYQFYMEIIKKTNLYIYRFTWAGMMPYRWLIEMEDTKQTEESIVKEMTDNKETMPLGMLTYGRLARAFWSRDEENWLQLADIAHQTIPESASGLFACVDTWFLTALVYLSCYPKMNKLQQEQYLHHINHIIKKFDMWAKRTAGVFQHKYWILKAERNRVTKNNSDKIVQYFENAIESATEHSFSLYAALANELLAKFWLERKRTKYAGLHMQSAFYFYDRSGAKAKVRQLSTLYPELVHNLKTTNVTISPTHNHLMNYELDIDIQAVMKLSQTVSEEQDNQKISKTMQLIIESAHAQRGVFLVLQDITNDNASSSSSSSSIASGSSGNKWMIISEAQQNSAGTAITTCDSKVPLELFQNIPKSIILQVARTKEPVVIGNVLYDQQFNKDSFFVNHQSVTSIICLPILEQQEWRGILYLENNRFSALLESEKKYKALTAELQATKKMLEEFIDMLCHELRNPLNAVAGNQSILHEVITSLKRMTMESSGSNGNGNGGNHHHHHQKRYEEMLRVIDSNLQMLEETCESIGISSNHMKDIVDTVLTVSMLENKSVKLQNVLFYPKDVVPQIGMMFRTKFAEKKLEFKAELPQENIQVIGDPYRLKEIIINLISNAIKFTHSGCISVSMQIDSKTESDVVIRFQVQDTGIGMEEEEQHRLFRSFSQANDSTNLKYGGFGLGLKISKELVHLMGGDITLSSTKGKGSTFTFTVRCALPTTENNTVPEEDFSQKQPEILQGISMTALPVPALVPPVSTVSTSASTSISNPSTSTTTSHQQQQQQHPRQEAEANHGEKRQITALVVDDNLINQMVLVQIIKTLGHGHMKAFNGLEAFQIYEQVCKDPEQRIDVIFMDIQMPVLDGYASTSKIRAYEREHNLRAVPIVGISANARAEHAKAAIHQGMNYYITKPYNKHDIIGVLNKLFTKEEG